MWNQGEKTPSAAEGSSGNRQEDLPRLLIPEPPLLSSTHQPLQILHYHHVPNRKADWYTITSGQCSRAAYPSPEMPSWWAGQKSHHSPKALESHHHCPVLVSASCPRDAPCHQPGLLAPCWVVTLAERVQGSSLQLPGISWQSPTWLQRFISITAQRWLGNDHQTICCGVLESSASK